jgi:hypothetical protein
MGGEKRILSLTAALAGLVATVPAQAGLQLRDAGSQDAIRGQLPAGPVEDNDFVLLPGTDADGSIYLAHGSHSSHSSHSSHRSHHSSR